MNLPKWSIIASAVVVVIAVIIIAIPTKKENGGETITLDSQNNTEATEIIEQPEQETPDTEEAKDTEAAEDAEEPKDTEAEEASETPEEIAERLSTEENANATDFEWFMDMELSDGTGAGVVVTEPGRVERITGSDNALLDGGWKAYQLDTISDPGNPEAVRYFNVDIDTEGEKFNITMNWAYIFLSAEGKSVTETGNDLFEGSWDAASGTAEAQSEWAKVEFDNFFMASDRSAEYATGTFYWISGEVERIALMRVAK